VLPYGCRQSTLRHPAACSERFYRPVCTMWAQCRGFAKYRGSQPLCRDARKPARPKAAQTHPGCRRAYWRFVDVSAAFRMLKEKRRATTVPGARRKGAISQSTPTQQDRGAVRPSRSHTAPAQLVAGALAKPGRWPVRSWWTHAGDDAASLSLSAAGECPTGWGMGTTAPYAMRARGCQ
jgi:hypothetical protein